MTRTWTRNGRICDLVRHRPYGRNYEHCKNCALPFVVNAVRRVDPMRTKLQMRPPQLQWAGKIDQRRVLGVQCERFETVSDTVMLQPIAECLDMAHTR
jgi:hypothetical protein